MLTGVDAEAFGLEDRWMFLLGQPPPVFPRLSPRRMALGISKACFCFLKPYLCFQKCVPASVGEHLFL